MTLSERKYRALDLFLRRLLRGPIKDHMAKVVLFGSVAKGKAQYDVIITEEHFAPILALAEMLQKMLAEKLEETEERS